MHVQFKINHDGEIMILKYEPMVFLFLLVITMESKTTRDRRINSKGHFLQTILIQLNSWLFHTTDILARTSWELSIKNHTLAQLQVSVKGNIINISGYLRMSYYTIQSYRAWCGPSVWFPTQAGVICYPNSSTSTTGWQVLTTFIVDCLKESATTSRSAKAWHAHQPQCRRSPWRI